MPSGSGLTQSFDYEPSVFKHYETVRDAYEALFAVWPRVPPAPAGEAIVKPERKRRKIEREFGVPVAGEILDPSQWTQTALKKLPDGPARPARRSSAASAPLVVDLGCGNGRFLHRQRRVAAGRSTTSASTSSRSSSATPRGAATSAG